MQTGRIGSDSPFPPGIPAIPNPSLRDSSSSRHPKHAPVSIALPFWMEFSIIFLGGGGIPEVQPKIHPGPVWFRFAFSSSSSLGSFPNSSRIQGAEFHALLIILREIINIYNLEIYICIKEKKKGGGGRKKIQEKPDLFS